VGTLPWIRAAWAAQLPELTDEACRRWSLTLDGTLGGLASRVVAVRDAAGRALVLKIAPVEALPELEAAALRHWSGSGAALLVAFDEDLGALLMERIEPGTPLPPENDPGAIAAAVATLRRLHGHALPDVHAFPAQTEFLKVWLERVRASAEPGTAGLTLLDAALEAALALEASATARVLLHGDFVDKNLLLGSRGYVAIDPIPRTGDPCSDVGFFAAYHPRASQLPARARDISTLMGLEPDRAARWAAVWAVGEATETWRSDSAELQAWVGGREAATLLGTR
jgi:streptomycin 6-kinase